jgi:Bacterial protein of unknown function (DUF916)
MNSRRQLVHWVTTLLVAGLASVVPSTGVGATVPPTTPASPTDTPATDAADPTDPQIIESWTLSPAVPEETPDAPNRANLSYLVDPGSTTTDAVTVYNFGNVSQNFKIYATDAFNDEQGQFAVLRGDESPADVGTWLTFGQENVTVLPGQQVTIPVTIKVPADASPGDHVGAVLASSPTIGTGEQGQVITLDRRTGTRLYVRVNGALRPNLALSNLATTYHQSKNPFGGSSTVGFRVTNRGNIRLSGTPTVSIGGAFGLGETRLVLADIAELLPGEEVDLTVDLADVPAMLVNFTKVQLVPHGADDATTSVLKGTTFAPPLTLLVVLLVVILALLWRRRRRRAALPQTNDSALRPAKSGHELQHQR